MKKEKEEERRCSWDEAEKIINKEKNILFGCFIGEGDECQACDYYEEVMELTAQQAPHRFADVAFGAVSVDPKDPSCVEIAEKLNVTEWPTLIAFREGKELGRIAPVGNYGEDIKKLKEFMAIFSQQEQTQP